MRIALCEKARRLTIHIRDGSGRSEDAMSTLKQTPSGSPRLWQRLNVVTVVATVGIIALVLVALVGYTMGIRHGERTTVLTGDFSVGDHQATARVDDWSYGINDGVTWVDSTGIVHESGWPACLAPVSSTVRATFGEVTATAPQGESVRHIVWVDCRAASTH